jgi:hypothetical protein
MPSDYICGEWRLLPLRDGQKKAAPLCCFVLAACLLPRMIGLVGGAGFEPATSTV